MAMTRSCCAAELLVKTTPREYRADRWSGKSTVQIDSFHQLYQSGIRFVVIRQAGSGSLMVTAAVFQPWSADVSI
ncbi:MAG: hypothetical protein WAO76_13555 [Georgfuchsia sp.]